jgi:DNA-binding response OmpR family regulator
MKILLVEDELDLGAIVQKSLSHHQYTVDWVIDGTSGWEYITDDRSTYAVAIIDWMVPKLSGIELCRKLRASKYTLPILILTARDKMEAEQIRLLRKKLAEGGCDNLVETVRGFGYRFNF